MSYNQIIKKKLQPSIQAIKDDIDARRDKTFFWATGTQVYCGRQGKGKTISAVKHVYDIKQRFPECIIVTNLQLSSTWLKARQSTLKPEQQDELDAASPRVADAMQSRFLVANLAELLRDFDKRTEYILFSSMEELSAVLTGVNNARKGVVYVIDEIHTYFNALDSKNIPSFVFTEISQQRKQRKLIIGTSQLYLRMAKPFREQCDNLVMCNTWFGVFTTQRSYDGATLDQMPDGKLAGDMKKRGWFFQTRKIRNLYDTYQKVVSSSEQYETQTPVTFEINRKSLKALR